MNKNIIALSLLAIGASIVAGSSSSSRGRDMSPRECHKESVIAHLKTQGLTELVDNKKNLYFYHNGTLTTLMTENGAIFKVYLVKELAIEPTKKAVKAACKDIKHKVNGTIERTDTKHNHYFYHNGMLIKLVTKEGIVFNVSLKEIKATDILPKSESFVVRVHMKDGQK